MKRVIIVGAGASGVYLSILLKQKFRENIEVIVLEQNASPLKKLLASGNGRCNLSNKDIDVDCYQSDDQLLVQSLIQAFDMVEAMNDLGLYCSYIGQLLYPKSEQALSVKNVLMDRAESLGVLFFYEQEVLRIDQQQKYSVYTKQSCFQSDYVIFAMGSEAGKLSGMSKSRYDILKRLHLKVIEPIPSLVQFYTKPALKSLKGVRVKGTFRLLENEKVIHSEKGELLFTDYGVSGIAIMQLSAFYQSGHEYELSIDFFDEIDDKKFYEYIELRTQKGYNHFYDGLLNSKLSHYFESLKLSSHKEKVDKLKDFRLKIKGIRDAEFAQVMKGGLSLMEVTENLELKKYPQMYAMGEILNVAGMCGGYNLHFAFSCAYRVAKAIERT